MALDPEYKPTIYPPIMPRELNSTSKPLFPAMRGASEASAWQASRIRELERTLEDARRDLARAYAIIDRVLKHQPSPPVQSDVLTCRDGSHYFPSGDARECYCGSVGIASER